MARRPFLGILLLVATAAGSQSAFATGQLPLGTESAIEQGVRAINDGRVHEAGEIFAAAAGRDSTNPELRVGVALVAYLEGRYPDALSALRDALLIEP